MTVKYIENELKRQNHTEGEQNPANLLQKIRRLPFWKKLLLIFVTVFVVTFFALDLFLKMCAPNLNFPDNMNTETETYGSATVDSSLKDIKNDDDGIYNNSRAEEQTESTYIDKDSENEFTEYKETDTDTTMSEPAEQEPEAPVPEPVKPEKINVSEPQSIE